MDVVKYLEGRESLPTDPTKLNTLMITYHTIFVDDLCDRPFNEDEADRWIAFMKAITCDTLLRAHMQEFLQHVNDGGIHYKWKNHLFTNDRSDFLFEALTRMKLIGKQEADQ